ncbi:oxygenase MpaB family protein [Streptomyces sp. NPDC006967]|uniref:oxygenase MpaB family protein n=1 Tax=unclassified Streptomyces TaxID=2593676 RepID=UPI000CD4CAEF|nr:oxygenase MpaB family protein [Streptomyces sp. SM1]
MGLLTEGGAAVRDRIGHAIFSRVAGPDGPDNRARIHDTPGPRWFGPERPVRRVHGDASMFIGGLSALLLQSLHPLAMAANAVSLLPEWASRALRLPRVPPAESVCVRPLGTAVTAGIRWALAPARRTG